MLSLDPRARRLLHALIAQHIREGAPERVYSLAQQAGLEVSPATIRNIMANLEDVGLLAAPHTSAGRVPTAQAYRLFVDSLLEIAPLRDTEIERLREQIAPGVGTQTLLAQASEMLSAMSQFVGVVTVPQRAAFAFRHIEFMALDPQRVLAILVFADGEVQNRVVQVRRAFSPSELEQAANYLNAHFAGQPLSLIRTALLRELRDSPAQREASAYMNFLCRPDAAALLCENDHARLWPFFEHAGGAPWLTPALRDRYRAAWGQGLEGPLNWYRASPLRPPTEADPGVAAMTLDDEAWRVRVPTRVVWGLEDHALLPGLVHDLGRWIGELTLTTVPGASHWIVHERPALVAAEIEAALAG